MCVVQQLNHPLITLPRWESKLLTGASFPSSLCLYLYSPRAEPLPSSVQQAHAAGTAGPRAGGGDQAPEATMADLYGENKAYPDPYAAGKLPAQLIHARNKARAASTTFIYR